MAQTRRYSPPPSNVGEPKQVRDLYDELLAQQEARERGEQSADRQAGGR